MNVHSEANTSSQRVPQLVPTASDLRNGIHRDELVLHYQPQLDSRTKSIVGVEALVRWKHPTHGLLYPDRFISIAEESGLIIPAGEWVLRQSCAMAIKWRKRGIAPLQISVNVSAIQLRGHRFPFLVASVLAETGLAPQHLTLEITESCLMEDVKHVAMILTKLRAMGVKIALDDFGAGYSSLGQLRKLPIDLLKIDRSLAPDLSARVETVSIVRAIITMARSLKLQVLAEGVESSSQLQLLLESGCDLMQGYHISKPLPEIELQGFLSRRLNFIPVSPHGSPNSLTTCDRSTPLSKYAMLA